MVTGFARAGFLASITAQTFKADYCINLYDNMLRIPTFDSELDVNPMSSGLAVDK